MSGKSSSSKQASSRTPDSQVDVVNKSPLLLSSISLPADYYVSFVKLEAIKATQGHQDVELARRELVGRNDSRTLLEGSLPFVQLTKDQAILWIFCVESNQEDSGRLLDISFDNLQVIHKDRFQYKEIYPCSLSCSAQRTPCPDCLIPPQPLQPPSPLPLYRDRSPTDPNPSSRSTSPFPLLSGAQFTPPKPAACLLPRQSLRHPLRLFLAAVRDRFVDEVCQEGAKRKFDRRSARSFRGGFLLCPSTCQSDWGDEWDSPRRCRPLVHCRVAMTLHRSDILVSYKFALTYLSPLLSCIPLPPGSPLHLLPFSTPAYFVNTYAGPCSALIKQFELYLAGLGAGGWTSGHQGIGPTSTPEFAIVWVKIQTSPEEDIEERGFFAIWPSRLCVSVLPIPSRNGEKEFAYRREIQHPLPELPPALQPSPIPTAATVPARPPPSLHPPVSPIAVERPLQSPTLRSPNSKGSPKRSHGHRPSFSRSRSSLASQYLHSFRRHTLSRSRSLREIGDVAQNVGKFVDSVARERERERERIRRERDAAQQAAKQISDTGPSLDMPNDTQQQTPMDVVVESPSALMNASPSVLAGPSSHPAYPSPPDEYSPIQAGIIPKVEDDLQLFSSLEPQKHNVTQSTTPVVNFATFENLDESWMPNADFMMDLGMDFNMNVGMGSSTGAQETISGDPMKLDLDSFIFTDDDFNFFDDPPASAFPSSANLDTGNMFSAFDAPTALIPSPTVPTGLNAQGEVPSMSADTPWVSSRGPFASPTVSVFSHHNQNDTPAPDLVPASPSKSLATQSGPATPNVAFSTEGYLNAQPDSSMYGGLDQFDPVQFAVKHSLIDAKYTAGKFQLPSPSTNSSSDRSEYIPAMQPKRHAFYSAVTDPRVKVVRRLIGLKSRKHDPAVPPFSVLAITGSGDWTDISTVDDIHEDERSDSDEESDFEGSVDEFVLQHSRPSTPLPSYLPPGASLLATKFTHARLVPLSQNLPVSVPSFDEDDVDMDVHLVPTPVSPSAITRMMSDEMKRYLSLLKLLCDELLDNPVWASAWLASLVEQSQHNNNWFTDNCAWSDDVRFATTCCHAVSSTRTPTNIEQFSLIASPNEVLEGRDVLRLLEPTNVVVGKSDSLIQVSPPALRFWDKLGLSPRSGRKDVTAFVVHNDQHDITDDAASWLADLSRLYTTRAFGNHLPGSVSACKEDGILVIHFDNFRKNMSSILQLPDLPSGPLVFYVITSVSMLSTLSPALRQLLAGIKHILSNNPDGMLYFHLIPDHACKPSDCHYSKEMQEEIVQSVYDRIRRPTYKMLSRQLHSEKANLCKNFKAPAFTLARPNPGSVSLEFEFPERISSVSDRHMLLHVGFAISESRRWLIAVCLDERHEMHEIGIWKLEKEQTIASNLWDFAMKFAAQANIEWRVVFAKLGSITESDLDAWNGRAASYLTTDGENVDLHASLVCFEDETWLLDDVEEERVSPGHKVSPDSPSRGSVLSFRDSTFLLSHVRCPTFSAPNLKRFEWGHIPKDVNDDPSNDFEEPLRPLHTSILINYGVGVNRQPSGLHARYLHLMSSVASARSTLRKTDQENITDICQSFCDLAFLQSVKRKEGSPSPLPSHLAAVALVRSILDLSA